MFWKKIGGVSLQHIRINSYSKLVKACVLHLEDQNISKLIGHEAKWVSRQVFKVCIIQTVEHSESCRQGLWTIMFIVETQAILEVYPTYLRYLMNNLRCHYCEFTETAFQWKGNLHALVTWKQVRENNDLHNHAAKILSVLNVIMCCYNFKLWGYITIFYSDNVSIFMHWWLSWAQNTFILASANGPVCIQMTIN